VKRLSEQTLYEILEVPPDAPPAAVRAAIERAREVFGPGSLAMYSLMSPDEASLMNRRIEEAWVTLLDPEARARYDAGLGGAGQGASSTQVSTWSLPPVAPDRDRAPTHTPAPGAGSERHAGATALSGPQTPVATEPREPAPSTDGEGKAGGGPVPARAPLQLVSPVVGQPPAAAPLRAPIRLDRPVSSPPPPPVPAPLAAVAPAAPPAADQVAAFPEDAAWTGEMLRRVRESRGVPIQIIAERTKVTRHHLENIEADRFALLPAPVYLRGILVAFARELRLDGPKVARSYLDRMAAATRPPPSPPDPKR
jgi:hypothetical protein